MVGMSEAQRRYSSTRRQTVNYLAGERGIEESLLGEEGQQHVFGQRRETSGTLLYMKETGSRKTLTSTEQSKKQLQEVVIVPDPNEGLDMEEYNRALLYISSSQTKRQQIHKAEMERKMVDVRSSGGGGGGGDVHARLYRDAELLRERKEVLTSFVEQERAREWNEVRQYQTHHNQASTSRGLSTPPE